VAPVSTPAGTDGGTETAGHSGAVTASPPPASGGPAAQAAIDKAVADAAKARADAEKAAAEARSAAAKAASDERDAAWSGSAAALAQREAEARKAAAEAEKATTAAQRDQIAALLPDLSKVERGTFEIKGDQPLFGQPLAQRALGAAADTLAQIAADVLPKDGSWRLLITNDTDLVTSHATYLDVVTGLDQLLESIDDLLPKLPSGTTRELAPLIPVIGAVASALPGLLSLFTTNRTVSTASVTFDDLAAGAAAAGAIAQINNAGPVVHDDVRLLSRGRVHQKLQLLMQKRQELVGHKLALTTNKATATTELATAKRKVEQLAANVVEASDDTKAAHQLGLGTAQREADRDEHELEVATVKLGLADSLLTYTDAFVTSITSVSAGAKRSPLAVAAARERLHDVEAPVNIDQPEFTHVLLVRGNGGSAQQTVDDRRWRDDRYAVVATATITYLLLQTSDSAVLAAGNAGGSAAGSGTIGDGFELRIRPSPFDPPRNER
jgi:hypothetical protein